MSPKTKTTKRTMVNGIPYNQHPDIMKRIFLTLAICLASTTLWAQGIFTVVYATSDDGFVNVRSRPSTRARIVSKVYPFYHGLGNAVLRSESGNWSKVSVGNITGWAYTKYLGQMTWYTGKGSKQLVAASANTPIYVEDLSDEGRKPVFTTVSKGTIIADEFQEEGDYYMLITAHDNLYIRKRDAKVVNAR